MLFGRAHEELEALAGAGIPVEVVPGITAALAASASLKASLTRRGVARHVAFVTPRAGEGESPAEWIQAAMSADTVALYMASDVGSDRGRTPSRFRRPHLAAGGRGPGADRERPICRGASWGRMEDCNGAVENDW